MYDWIPMEFDVEFVSANGEARKYLVRANGRPKKYFTTFNSFGEIGNSAYPLEALMLRLEKNSGTINGKTLAELTEEYTDDEIDISSLI